MSHSEAEIEEFANIVGALVAGGKSMDTVRAWLKLTKTPAELIELAIARHELRLMDISGLAVVADEEGKTHWYAGPQALDRFWPPVRAKLETRLAAESVEEIDKVTNRTMSLLHAPGTPSFSSRGLVLGYVQSGKTTNFMALAAKAADAGYKLVVILSGMTDILRNQTQERIDDVLVGDSMDWYTLTKPNADFQETNDPAPLFAKFPGALVAVIKKNPSRLRRLRDWMRSAGRPAMRLAPLLLIDDEADQASIDVGDIRTSTINGLLREILQHPRSAYVAYTATPFANLLIDPKNGTDLYPRDFVVSMPRPEEYFGAEELFGAIDDPDAAGIDAIRSIPAAEAAAAKPPSGAGAVHTWTPVAGAEMHRATLWFILATAARRVRESRTRHSSMLIHTSMLSEAHFRTRDAVADALGGMRIGIATDSQSLRDDARILYETEIARVKADEFQHVPVPFEDVWKAARAVAADVDVIVDNYRSDDRLSYSADRPVTAIVIGGNTLSRGLTLEGLCASYFVRSASAYDTLLQMGRWFGYRPGYEDLCRIWMTDELRGWFRDLSMVEQEIRDEIARYAIEGLTPLELGVRIRLHPHLAITEAAKMKHAVQASLSYSGRSPQTTIFNRLNAVELDHNLRATERLLDEILTYGGETEEFRTGASLNRRVGGFRDVPVELVLRYLDAYRFHEEQRGMTSDLLTAHIRDEIQRDSLLRWRVVVMSGPDGETYEFPGVGAVRSVVRSRIPTADEAVGAMRALSSADDRTAGIDWHDGETPPKGAALSELRLQRHPGEGILRLYPIDRISPAKPGQSSRVALDAVEMVIGMSVDFPLSHGPANPIGYVIADVPGSDAVEETEDPKLADDADEESATDG